MEALIENPRIKRLLSLAGITQENLKDPELKKIITAGLERIQRVILENKGDNATIPHENMEDIIVEITRAVLIALCDVTEKIEKEELQKEQAAVETGQVLKLKIAAQGGSAEGGPQAA